MGRWMNCKFQEEQEEFTMGVERCVINILVDKLLVDLLLKKIDYVFIFILIEGEGERERKII